MKSISLLVTLFVLLLFNCAKDNSPISSLSDEFLQTKVIGTWEDEGIWRLQFNSDGTFTARCSVPEDDSLKLQYIIEGDYFIEDAIISFTNFEYTFIKKKNVNVAASTILFQAQIQSEDDRIKFRRVDVFKPLNSRPGELWDRWENRRWRAVFNYRDNKIYKVYQLTTYEFHPDSATAYYTCEYLFSAPSPSWKVAKYNFSYKSPYLDLFKAQNIRVVFKKDKMLWYYDEPPRKHVRVN